MDADRIPDQTTRDGPLALPEFERNGILRTSTASEPARRLRLARQVSITETVISGRSNKLKRGEDFPDFEITDFFPQTEAGGVQNKTLFYLTSSTLNLALMASNVADIARWAQRRGTDHQQGAEILIIVCIMLVSQIGMLFCFCFKMYNSSALQTILDRTSTPEERAAKEKDVLKSLGFSNKLTVILIALALIISVLQIAYKVLSN